MPKQESIIEATKKPGAEDILRFLRSTPGLRPSQAGDGKERATAGAMGLNPADRLAISKHLEHREHTDKAVAGQQASEAEFEAPDNGIPTTSLEAQLGRVMTREQVVSRLKKLNSNFYFERSNNYPELMGIYWIDKDAPVREGKRLRIICSMEYGFSPEWSIPNLKALGPKKLTRGWRDLYLKLVARGYFTLHDAENLFETKRSDRQSAKYMRAVQVTMHRLKERGLDTSQALRR